MTVTIHPAEWSDYDVHGHTLDEVARHIEQMTEAGQTHWHATYHVTRWGDANNIAAAAVDVRVTVSMPHWAGRHGRPAAEVAEWERFLGALHAHEQGHIDLVQQYLQYADTLIEGCTEQTAAQQWQDNLNALQQASDDYDASNDHGRNAGTTIELPDSSTDEAESEEGAY